MIKHACDNQLKGYRLPTYDRLRTTLLQAEKANVELHLKSIKLSWNRKGVSIVSDGWTDSNRKRSLINFMAASENGPVFLKAVDATDEVKSSEYIGKLFLEVVSEVGASNVVQLITDNAIVCKQAGLKVEAKYPAIVWTPCVVHTLNLALKNICTPTKPREGVYLERYEQFKWMGEIDIDVRLIRNFVVNHSATKTIYSKYSKLKLIGVTETRFASTLILVKQIFQVKSGLQRMVIDDSWKFYKEDDSQKAQKIKDMLVSDAWWEKIEFLLDFTEPIVSMLRAADTDAPILHLVYEKWDSMIEEVRKRIFKHGNKNVLIDESNFCEEVHKVLVERWDKSITPLHCLAHSLNPKYYSDEWLAEGINRAPPNLDEEVSEGRNACFERLYESLDKQRKVREEYGKFSTATGNFGRWEALSERYTSDPLAWWGNHGSSAPTLAALAFRVLGQPASSSCCERNWSTFGLISSVKRNRLTSQRAEDLVHVHSNLRLLSRKQDHYVQGPTMYWDVVGDEFSIDGATEMDLANLSLDDPVIEAMHFGPEEVVGADSRATDEDPSIVSN